MIPPEIIVGAIVFALLAGSFWAYGKVQRNRGGDEREIKIRKWLEEQAGERTRDEEKFRAADPLGAAMDTARDRVLPHSDSGSD